MKSKSSGTTVNRSALARILGVSLRQIGNLEAEGFLTPLRRGRGGRPSIYRLEDVVPLYIARVSAPATGQSDRSARARRETAQAELIEQTHKVRSRELLPAAEVEKVWSAEVAAVRSAVLATYTTRADQLHLAATIAGVAGVEAELKTLAYELLRELSNPDRPIATGTES